MKIVRERPGPDGGNSGKMLSTPCICDIGNVRYIYLISSSQLFISLWCCLSIDIFLSEGRIRRACIRNIHRPFCHPCLPVAARQGFLSIHWHDGRHGVRPPKRVSSAERRDHLGLLLGDFFFIRGSGAYRPVEIEEKLLIVAFASAVVLLVGRRPAEYPVWQDVVEHPAKAGRDREVEPPQITFVWKRSTYFDIRLG